MTQKQIEQTRVIAEWDGYTSEHKTMKQLKLNNHHSITGRHAIIEKI